MECLGLGQPKSEERRGPGGHLALLQLRNEGGVEQRRLARARDAGEIEERFTRGADPGNQRSVGPIQALVTAKIGGAIGADSEVVELKARERLDRPFAETGFPLAVADENRHLPDDHGHAQSGQSHGGPKGAGNVRLALPERSAGQRQNDDRDNQVAQVIDRQTSQLQARAKGTVRGRRFLDLRMLGFQRRLEWVLGLGRARTLMKR